MSRYFVPIKGIIEFEADGENVPINGFIEVDADSENEAYNMAKALVKGFNYDCVGATLIDDESEGEE